MRWHAPTCRVVRWGRVVCLTRTQFRIFQVLHEHTQFGRELALSRDAIMARVYADRVDGGPENPGVVSVHISMLRRRLAHIGLRVVSNWNGYNLEWLPRDPR